MPEGGSAHRVRGVASASVQLDTAAMQAARDRLDRLTKPPGSLGVLEDVAAQLCGIAGAVPPPFPGPAAVAVFAGDHGVVASGVTPWPSEVTAQMVANFAAGGAAICVLARQVGASIAVVDVGVASPLDPTLAIAHRRVRSGTADLAHGPAMTTDEATQALEVGRQVAIDLIDEGARLLVTGDMGIGNTTASACLIGHFTGTDAPTVTGRGTGIDDERLARKQAIVATAMARAEGLEPLAALAEVGGLEIAALAGYLAEGVRRRIPVLIDGVIALAALCVAEALWPGVRHGCIAGHRSTEPGASRALQHHGLRPLLELDLRLGEGTGACLAVPIVQAAARIITEMASFDDVGIEDASQA